MPNVDDLYDENVEFEIERKKIEDHNVKCSGDKYTCLCCGVFDEETGEC